MNDVSCLHGGISLTKSQHPSSTALLKLQRLKDAGSVMQQCCCAHVMRDLGIGRGSVPLCNHMAGYYSTTKPTTLIDDKPNFWQTIILQPSNGQRQNTGMYCKSRDAASHNAPFCQGHKCLTEDNRCMHNIATHTCHGSPQGGGLTQCQCLSIEGLALSPAPAACHPPPYSTCPAARLCISVNSSLLSFSKPDVPHM